MFGGFTKKQAHIISEMNSHWFAPLTIFNGAIRSGKTFLTYFIIPMLIWTYEGGRGIITGKTLGTIEENILKPMRDLFPANVGEVKIDATGNRYVVLFGTEVRLVGANDKASEYKIRGATYAWAVCDEVTTYPKNVFAMLISRLSEPGAVCICTTNPDIPSHWLKVDYIDKNNEGVKVYNFTIDDNPTLSPEYVEHMKRTYEGTEFYDRFILGKWVSGSGAIYKLFTLNNDRFIFDDTDEPVKYVEYACGVDFGENVSRTVFKLVGLRYDYKGVDILAEKSITKHGDVQLLQKQFIDFLHECKGYGYRVDYAYYDNAQRTLGESLKTAVARDDFPCNVKPCVKDEIIERIHLTIALMGAGMLRVHKRCNHAIKAFNDAVYKEGTEERLDEVSEVNVIDDLDTFEYAIQSWSNNLRKIALFE